MSLLHHLHPAVTAGSQVDVIYTDFSAAFDCISHRLLIAKLERLGISDPLLSWLESFLTGRTSRVRTSVKDLGVHLDDALTFTPHIDAVICKANKTNGLISRLASEFQDPCI
uniref:Uncharacterized protein n=1 Tax=Anopheles atroparvus TaxID=41427 RepID=A0A182INQ9_ANOAO